jgi:CTP synthase (UTP-ammonia lyase)
MPALIKLALVGDYDSAFVPHVKTDEAVAHMGPAMKMRIDAQWIPTTELQENAADPLSGFDAIWIVPGSPYRSLLGALNAIRHAREQGIPTLGTCGGCQHMVIEYARNVLGFRDAQHAEYDPYASNLFVTPLSCSLVGETMDVMLKPGSQVAEIYGRRRVKEQYYCNFGINPAHRATLDNGGFCVVGEDADGEPRIFALPAHPFFMATLFVPQLTSTVRYPHPLIAAFLKAAMVSDRCEGKR